MRVGLLCAVGGVGAIPSRLKGQDMFIAKPSDILPTTNETVVVQVTNDTFKIVAAANFTEMVAPNRVLYNGYLDNLNHTQNIKFDRNVLLTGYRPGAGEDAGPICGPQRDGVWNYLPTSWADFFFGEYTLFFVVLKSICMHM
jgi:hypothetical protein